MKTLAILSGSIAISSFIAAGNALAVDCSATLLRSSDGREQLIGSIGSSDARSAQVENDRGATLQRIGIKPAPRGTLSRQFSVPVSFRIIDGERLRVRWVDARGDSLCKAPLIAGSLVPVDGFVIATGSPDDRPRLQASLEGVEGATRQPADTDLARRALIAGADLSAAAAATDDLAGDADLSADDAAAMAGYEDIPELSFPQVCSMHSVRVSRTSLSAFHAFPSPLRTDAVGHPYFARAAYIELRDFAGVILTTVPARLVTVNACRRALLIASGELPDMDLRVGSKVIVDLVVAFSESYCPVSCGNFLLRARYTVAVQ